MASTGNVFAGTGANVDRAGATDWSNPTRITADDNSLTLCSGAASGGDYLVASNFGFSIPTDATILGVTYRVEASEHSAGTETCYAQLQDESAALIGSSKSQTVSGTSKVVYTYGGTADKWGATLTPAIVNDPDFGVRFWFETGHDLQVDYATVAIEYAEAQALTPTLFTNDQTFYAPTVTQPGGAQDLTPSLFTNTNTFYAPTVSATYRLTPSLFTNDQTFYGPTVAATYTIEPGLYSNTQTFYAPTVSQSGGAVASEAVGQTPAGRPRRYEVETRGGEIRTFDNPNDAQAYLESLRQPEEPTEKPKRRRRKKKASEYPPQREVETVRFDDVDLRGFDAPGIDGFIALMEQMAMAENYAHVIRHMDILRDDEEMMLFM